MSFRSKAQQVPYDMEHKLKKTRFRLILARNKLSTAKRHSRSFGENAATILFSSVEHVDMLNMHRNVSGGVWNAYVVDGVASVTVSVSLRGYKGVCDHKL